MTDILINAKIVLMWSRLEVLKYLYLVALWAKQLLIKCFFTFRIHLF